MGIMFSYNHRIKVEVAPWWPVCAKCNMAAEARDLKYIIAYLWFYRTSLTCNTTICMFIGARNPFMK